MKKLFLLITCFCFYILISSCTDTKIANLESGNESGNVGSYDTISVPFLYYFNEIIHGGN